MNTETWTIRDVLNWSAAFLKKNQSDTFRLDAEVLLADCLNCQRIDLYLNYDKPLSQEERQGFRERLKRRAGGEPIAYITGYREFFGYRFSVTKDVLIPRPETEHLIEKVEEILIKSYQNQDQVRILDIGTGSGCIAITLKKRFPKIQIEAWDISEKSLDLARLNAKLHHVDINFRQNDALNPQCWNLAENQKWDIICSNPPYISYEEATSLSRTVKEFEPSQALFAEDQGLIFYRTFAQYTRSALSDVGWFVAEIGSEQGEAVQKIFLDSRWANISIAKDLAGHDRVLSASLNPVYHH